MTSEPKSSDADATSDDRDRPVSSVDQEEVDDAVRDALKDTTKLAVEDIEAAIREREASEAQKKPSSSS